MSIPLSHRHTQTHLLIYVWAFLSSAFPFSHTHTHTHKFVADAFTIRWHSMLFRAPRSPHTHTHVIKTFLCGANFMNSLATPDPHPAPSSTLCPFACCKSFSWNQVVGTISVGVAAAVVCRLPSAWALLLGMGVEACLLRLSLSGTCLILPMNKVK